MSTGPANDTAVPTVVVVVVAAAGVAFFPTASQWSRTHFGSEYMKDSTQQTTMAAMICGTRKAVNGRENTQGKAVKGSENTRNGGERQ